jgi:CubicO group peptidase (beta-lactamase class C family)
MRCKLLFCSFLFIAATSLGQTHPFQKKFPSVDGYIDSLLKDWNIPGLALGIVYKDQLIYAKGYGYRDLEKKLPVNH